MPDTAGAASQLVVVAPLEEELDVDPPELEVEPELLLVDPPELLLVDSPELDPPELLDVEPAGSVGGVEVCEVLPPSSLHATRTGRPTSTA